MSINCHKPHLTVLFEDKPYRDILNGVKLSMNVNENVIDSKNPCGGWMKVFDKLKDELKFLNQFEHRYILLLIDFDYKFDSRYKKFKKEISPNYGNRVFILGVDNKESENLKRFFEKSNFEEIGKILIENCPNGNLEKWENKHLECNLNEITRMKDNRIFDWLFK